ncbi:MAG: histidine kinase [Acidobacteriota bacterium]|nr:histidine kinase [Acidobacteriota bacterium]
MNFRKLFVTASIILACLASNTFALDPFKSLSQYIRSVWTTEDGLPQNAAFSVVQTPDGYLWFGTLAGLVRFDGIEFKVFDQSNTKELTADSMAAVYVDSKGTLWAATGGVYGASGQGNNLLSYRNGKFRSYTKEDGFFGENVLNFAGANDGGLWIATSRGLYKYTPENGFHFYTVRDGLSNGSVWAVYESSDKSVWVGTSTGLDRFRDGKFTTVVGDGETQINAKAIRESSDGSIWCATQKGLIRIKGESLSTYTTTDGLPENEIASLATDRSGNLWIGTVHGRLSRFRDDKFAESISLGDLDVWSIYEDREGNLWAGVFARGLYRLKDGNFKTFAQTEGLLADGTWGIYENRSGGVWVATDVGVSEIKDGKIVKSYTQKDGLLDIIANMVFVDAENSLWIGSTRGITRLKNGKFDSFLFPFEREHWVSAFYQDAGGILWIGTSRGLYQFKDGKFINSDFTEKSRKFIINAINPSADGVLWLGTNVGLVELKNGEFTIYSVPDPKSPDHVTSISEDSDDGTLWLTTMNHGVLRFKDGKFTRYTVNEGLSDNILYHVLDDRAGNLWFGGNKGIFKIGKQELNDFADGKTNVLSSKIFDTSDGMRSRECNGVNSAMRDRNGNLWFPTLKGAVEIDPASVKLNQIPPPVSIEKSIVDGIEFEESAEIEPGSHNFEFHYAGLSLIAPQKVKFKYILEGYDKDWVDAGTRREAFYTNLPAGNYTFSVIAANNDGVWSKQGASVRFLVRAPFWRTSWFWALCLAALVALVYFAYRARISLYEKRQLQQETFARRLIVSQEAERKRIAGELHDSLGQMLLIIKNRAFLGLKAIENDDAESKSIAASREQLGEIFDSAAEAIDQTRQIAYALRPLNLERLGLTAALEEMLDKVAASSGILFDVEIIELYDFLPLDAQINLFRIAQESINNIVRHSGATNASVSVARVDDRVEIKITDNGKGFDTLTANENGARTAGLGLTSIAERARILGANYSIESTPGAGTSVYIGIDIKKEHEEEEK